MENQKFIRLEQNSLMMNILTYTQRNETLLYGVEMK